MTDATLAPTGSLTFRRNDYSEALLHAGVAIVIVIASVSAFAVSTTFGIAATFAITLLVAIVLPAGIPFLIATSFLFQNAVIAWYTPLIPDTTTFDAMRAYGWPGNIRGYSVNGAQRPVASGFPRACSGVSAIRAA